MTLPELKQLLEQGEIPTHPIIMRCDLNHYIPTQYAKKWAENKQLRIQYVDDLSDIQDMAWMQSDIPNTLSIYKVAKVEDLDESIKSYKGSLLIISPSIAAKIVKSFADMVIEVKALERWQIKDYLNVVCAGLQEAQVEQLIDSYEDSVSQLMIEVDKLMGFPEGVRKDYFEELKASGNLVLVDKATIWDFVNALQNKDITTLRSLLTRLQAIDVEPTGLITTVHGMLKKLIKVWLNPHPTEANTGLSSKQIYAIGRLQRTYDQTQLIKAMKMITDVECRLIDGQLSEDEIIDYIVVKLLAA